MYIHGNVYHTVASSETVSEHVNVVYLSLYKTLVSIKKPLSEKRDEGYSGVTIVNY